MKIGIAIDDAQEAEMALAKQLVTLAERHQSEADVYHMSLARAHACAEHVWRIRPFVEKYDARAVDVDDATTPGLIDTLRQGAAAVGHVPTSGLVLMTDLRDAYVAAHRVEICWIVVQQAAKAARDSDLLGVVGVCVEEADQTWKWLRTRIKDGAPEAFATS
jgi:hypothetical protein